MLHVLNGDATRESLERSGVPGRITVWGDVLYEGPVPRDVGDDNFARVRADFHAGSVFSYDDALAKGQDWNRGLTSYSPHEEVVLWFEHDLHDQLLLVSLLDWFARRAERPAILSLICIGAFPGVEPFHGLGQLSPEQLASLLDIRTRVTREQLALGESMWAAFTGDDPTEMERVLARDTAALPFLDGAIRRMLEDFPHTQTGLPRTERTILEILAERAPLEFGKLFPLLQKTEDRVFMGDSTLWERVEDLARGSRPLVTIGESEERDGSFLKARISITDDGRRVLAGEEDWMRAAPFDRWVGGAHLVAPDVEWRWNGHSLERVLSS